MRKVLRSAPLLIASAIGLGALVLPAAAQDYIIQQNQNGFDLPGVALPQGQDEVRAADGTTCSTAISGNGAYLDVGVIRGTRGTRDNNDFASYGRLVVPLGRKPKRLDCTKLYELEIERLRLELELTKMGVGGGPSPEVTSSTAAAAPTDEVAAPAAVAAKPARAAKVKPKKAKNWATDGWTDQNNR